MERGQRDRGALDERPARVLLTPQGEPLRQERVEELATSERLLMIAGHYEGLDERVIEELEPLEISVGDYVLSGGELPAMTLVDAIVRLLPGVLGHEDSAAEDSFSTRDEQDFPCSTARTTRDPANGVVVPCPTSCSAGTTVPWPVGDVNNRSSGRRRRAPTSSIHRDPWATRLDPRRGNPTAARPLEGNIRATAREPQRHEPH